jgi:uncharacterized membrane-anchored protein
MAKSIEDYVLAMQAKEFNKSVLAQQNPNDWWLTQDGRLCLIKDMDFSHLENIVNFFSQEGRVVDPMMQGAFEKVMLTYLRKQAEINDVHKDIL